MKGLSLVFYLFSILFLAAGLYVKGIENKEGVETITIGSRTESNQIVYNLPLENGTLLIRITLPDNFQSSGNFPVLLAPGLDGGNLETGCRYFGKDPEQHGWILVESLVHLKGVRAMNRLLDYLDGQYKVEGFHLLGFSANSVPQFKMARQLSKRISSVTGMPGHPEFKNTAALNELEDFKVLMVVGEKDYWWKNSATKARQKMQEYGLPVNLLVVADGGHILDEFAGKPLFKELEKLRTTQ